MSLTSWLNSKLSAYTANDQEVYRRVETLKKKVWEEHAQNKEEQKALLLEAAEDTTDSSETKKLEMLVRKVEKEKREAELEARVRRSHLQSMVDAQARDF